MYNQQDAFNFIMTKKSAVAAVENFLEQFMDIYDELNKKDQELLSECFQQMFRKYYYSSLIPDVPLTPANIVNTLVERGFDKSVMLIPTLNANFNKNKKIKDIDIGLRAFGMGELFLSGIWRSC